MTPKSQPEHENIFIHGPISPRVVADALANHGENHAIGAHSIFIGQVRADSAEQGIIKAISYTAYKKMALERIHTIREELLAQYPLSCIHIYHSLGMVNAGEICLFVFTAAKNRKPAMEACALLVERIKKELPIWGKEISDQETAYWKENTF